MEILLAALLAALVFAAGVFGFQMKTGEIDWLPFGGNNSTRQQNDEQNRQAEVSRLTSPVFIAAGNGSGTFQTVKADSDLSTKSNGSTTAERMLLIAVKDYLSKSAVAEKITHNQFRDAASAETVTAQYSCGIPFGDFMNYHRMQTPSGSTVSYLSRLILSGNDGGTIYLYDGESDQYYRIKRNKGRSDVLTSDFVRGLAETISSHSDNTRYCIDSTWTGSVELLPEDPSGTQETELRTVPPARDFLPEYNISAPDSLAALESLFFPDGMDFIQKVKTADGSLIYMYGCMEKMLRIDSGGGVTYTQERENRTPTGSLKFLSSSQDFYGSLTLAVDYIKEHGGWPSDINESVIVRLSRVESIETVADDQTSEQVGGYRFFFSLELAGFPISYEKGSPLFIDIYGKDITAYHRDLPDLRNTTMQNIASSGGSSWSESGESSPLSPEEKSAFFSDGGSALNLKTVIQINSVILSDALIEDETEQQEVLTEPGNDVAGTDEILRRISAADLQLLRTDPSGSSSSSSTGTSGTSASDSTANGSTERDFSSENLTETVSSNGGRDWSFAPAWRLRIGNRSIWFHALTGAPLLNE